MAKPDWQSKQRDSNRGRGRDYREPLRDNVVFHPASSGRPPGPRQGDAKVQPVKQGVNGALRAANLRLLLENAPLREVLALVAEVPLERLEAMSRGALCPDETAFHIERTLRLPGKWLDGLNKEVPARTLELLKNPDKAGLHDDDLDEDASASPPLVIPALAQPAAEISAAIQPVPHPPQASTHAAPAQRVQVAEVVASASVEPCAAATSAQGAAAAQGDCSAVDGAQALASLEDSRAAAKPVAQEATPTTETAEAQRVLSAIATRSKPGPNETCPMSSPELRKQNLSVLLQGKGAKSALARLIGISQPYMSTIANGGKVLDQEFCRKVAQTLGLPTDWFEAPRTVEDIPAATLQRLAPLPRGGAANTLAAPASDAAGAQTAPAATTSEASEAASAAVSAELNEPATSMAGIAEPDTETANTAIKATSFAEKRERTRPAARHGSQQLSESGRRAGEGVRPAATDPRQADLLAHVELDGEPVAQQPAPALQTEAAASPVAVLDTVSLKAPASASAYEAIVQPSSFAPVSAPSLVIEGGLAPITEALIKTLVLKARQGALSEDRAFDLLGAVRLL